MRSTDRRQVDEIKLAQNTEINVPSLFAQGATLWSVSLEESCSKRKSEFTQRSRDAICEGNGLLIPQELAQHELTEYLGGRGSTS